jgi:hypothetical protein
MSVNAFHEKAGRSQVGWYCSWLDRVFLSGPPPLSPLFHPHSRRAILSLVPVGCSRFSRCCHLIVDLRFHLLGMEVGARRLTQSPEPALGFSLSSSECFDFMRPPARLSGCGCVTVRRLLRSPTREPTLLWNHSTHPIKEDVKKKHFSLPSRERRVWRLASSPASLLEGLWSCRFGSPRIPAAMPAPVACPNITVSCRGGARRPSVPKLRKLNVGLGANHDPI